MSTFDRSVRDALSFLDNQYASAVVTIFLMVHAAMAARNLPPYIANLFSYSAFRFFIFFLIAYMYAGKNPTTALLSALLFVLILMVLDRLPLDQYVHRTTALITSRDDSHDRVVGSTSDEMGAPLYSN